MRTFFRTLKVISVVTLAFLSWAYLPLYQVAAYAATVKQESVVSKQESGGKQKAENQKPDERFEKVLDDIREKVVKTEQKAAKGEDTTSEIESLKTKRAEVESLDTELKKSFAATEKKLKDANLPKEILDRHYKFVKYYESNLAELKANIEDIEKAKTTAALKTEVTKAKKHLDKVKPPKKRKPFDPNNLPNRLVKAKERQPKLKKEEWERELKKDNKNRKPPSGKNESRSSLRPMAL